MLQLVRASSLALAVPLLCGAAPSESLEDCIGRIADRAARPPGARGPDGKLTCDEERRVCCGLWAAGHSDCFPEPFASAPSE